MVKSQQSPDYFMENDNSLTAEALIYAYTSGVFPMAEADGTIYWYRPDPRAVIPIDTYKPAKSLKPVINRGQFEIRIDTQFEAVIRACASPRAYEKETWISEEIIQAYVELHHMGFAHSVESYLGGELVGGLYGVHFASAFFGESMFMKVSNASKVAFHHLMEILQSNGFTLLDTQFMNDNVERYGAVEIKRSNYEKLLSASLQKACEFKLPTK
ncbi:leucyl/phenylalanyl-tRNA--protein transferase [Aquirufa sp.]|jgi:leucyl/phenylalanyl-tRNA--protein transferase|uniref:leucyl/phenylalanyl-tRNA--protein transferase n=1 Tax=Aquirufa sp. TaxID=2676249 RepID=UPI0037C01373